MLSPKTTLDDLNARVSAAIFRAERVDPDSPEAILAYREVSLLEEQIASRIPADEVQGAVARVGAVTAALDADDWPRAARLAESFIRGAPDDLAEELHALVREAEVAAINASVPTR